jgi:SPP1 gp7 family putative phage head morphogenesis protein
MARAIQELKQRKNTAAVRRAAPASSVLTLPKAIDVAFLGPTHLDRVQALFIRQYESLKGITKGMSAKIGNTLADGMLKGDGPYTMARALAKDINISRVRARVIARTEVARAHNVGLVNTYREAGIEGVEVVAEFATAGDDRVCPHCQRLEDISKKKPFPLDKAEGLIPVHPNCRCTLIPIVTGLTKSRTEEAEDDVLDTEAEQS